MCRSVWKGEGRPASRTATDISDQERDRLMIRCAPVTSSRRAVSHLRRDGAGGVILDITSAPLVRIRPLKFWGRSRKGSCFSGSDFESITLVTPGWNSRGRATVIVADMISTHSRTSPRHFVLRSGRGTQQHLSLHARSVKRHQRDQLHSTTYVSRMSRVNFMSTTGCVPRSNLSHVAAPRGPFQDPDSHRGLRGLLTEA